MSEKSTLERRNSMEGQDYIQLHTLIAKLEVEIDKEFLYYENLSEEFKEDLENLRKGAELIKKNLYVKINAERRGEYE